MTFSGTQYRIDVTGWTPCGAPEYDLSKAVKLPVLDDAEGRGGMGAQKGLVSEDKNFMLYNSHYGVEHSSLPCCDIRTGKLVFAYPSNYVGVHGGHLAPPGRTGLIRAAYDIVGPSRCRRRWTTCSSSPPTKASGISSRRRAITSAAFSRAIR